MPRRGWALGPMLAAAGSSQTSLHLGDDAAAAGAIVLEPDGSPANGGTPGAGETPTSSGSLGTGGIPRAASLVRKGAQ